MKPQKSIEISRKGTHTFNYTLEDENGAAINITAATITMTAKKQRKDSSAVFSKAGSIVSATAGTFTVKLTPTETTIPAGVYFYDVVVAVSTDRYLAERGKLIVHPNFLT